MPRITPMYLSSGFWSTHFIAHPEWQRTSIGKSITKRSISDCIGSIQMALGAEYSEGFVSFKMIANPPVHIKGDYLIEYKYSLNTQTYADKLWRQGRVPYMLEEGMTPSQRAAIASAFDEYKGKTCIRFVPKQQEEQDHIFIKRNHALGCSSYVGRAGDNQTVSLEVDKCFSKDIIAHERIVPVLTF